MASLFRYAAIFAISAVATAGFAQIPDTKIKVDLIIHYRTPNGGRPTLRTYDSLGNHSKVILDMNLEPGYNLHVGQRLQKIPGSSDIDFFEEAYIEDPGLWRIGKQYIPFGAKNLIRESAFGVAGQTDLLLNGIPIVASAFDNGSGRTRGVSGRIGGRIGLSIGLGSYLASQATSLSALHAPEVSPGPFRGYGLILGIDAKRKIGRIGLGFEAVSLHKGETALDIDRQITEFSVNYNTKSIGGYRLSWARDWKAGENYTIGQATWQIYQGTWLEPYVRFREAKVFDAGVSLRIKF